MIYQDTLPPTPAKLCLACSHSRKRVARNEFHYACAHPKNVVGVSPVDGEYEYQLTCSTLRSKPGELDKWGRGRDICGYEGKWFSPKELAMIGEFIPMDVSDVMKLTRKRLKDISLDDL